ncbi:MAG: hypothetical protein HRT37_08745 [Alteromonadaceae bacterium]|nr:hypothetical protein [Alteromonadaceae bacterium]
MGMLGKKRRKAITVPIEVPTNNVQPISIDAMIINIKKGTNCYFKRLKFKGCPNIATGGKSNGNFKLGEELIDMKRDTFIHECWDIINSLPVGETIKSYFDSIIFYVKFLDIVKRNASFDEDNILAFHLYLNGLADKGGISRNTINLKFTGISKILREQGKVNLLRKIPIVKGRSKVVKSHKALSTEELKPIANILYHSFKALSAHFLANTKPEVHPFFDVNKLMKSGYTTEQIYKVECGARISVRGNWENHMIRCAMMITFMLTGMNFTPLCEMRRSDVKFKKGTGDSYTFDSVKGRANGQQQSNDIGFTKRAKEFVEMWLVISDKLSAGDNNSLLFPNITNDGTLGSWKTNPPQSVINQQLAKYGYAHINSSRFRKTRSDILMRVMNSVVDVAGANNTTVSTTRRSYLNGVEQDHQRSLAGAFQIQANIAKGADKKTAIDELSFKFKDPLSDFDYKALKRKTIPNKTPSGIRCENPKGDKAKIVINSLKKAGLDLNDSIKSCTDFLDYFGCDNHRLIAEKDDIWLMLSFKDTIEESLSRPSINSKPSAKFIKIFNTVVAILKRFKEIARIEYDATVEQNNEKSHPLYSDKESVNDLLGVYS